jgi:hypothetical protein
LSKNANNSAGYRAVRAPDNCGRLARRPLLVRRSHRGWWPSPRYCWSW